MVSTYLSPLGIAYTGLLVVPLAVTFALSTRRARWPWVAFALVVISIALSVTRLALICLAVESIVLAVVLRRRWAAAATGFALAAVVAGFLVYPSFGPIVSFHLADVRPPLGTQILTLIGGGQLPSPPPVEIGDLPTDMLNRMATSDASIQAHVASLRQGADFVVAHPLGVGLGASVPRFGTATGPGESGLFQIGAETGSDVGHADRTERKESRCPKQQLAFPPTRERAGCRRETNHGQRHHCCGLGRETHHVNEHWHGENSAAAAEQSQ